MSIVCEPAVVFPDRVLSQRDWVEKKMASVLTPEQLDSARAMARSALVEKRYFADDPLAEGCGDQSFEVRSRKFIKAGDRTLSARG